jgi:hypothetical protein
MAMMEAHLILATLVQRVTFALVPGQRIVPEPLITLRPRGGIGWWCGGGNDLGTEPELQCLDRALYHTSASHITSQGPDHTRIRQRSDRARPRPGAHDSTVETAA